MGFKRAVFLAFLLAIPLWGLEIIEDANPHKILTPSLQGLKTRKIRLDNGLEVYLISDPGAPQSAAALSVEAGSWKNPVEHPGMAHFLEHMLFLGTEKYPEESAYSTFIRDHGGMTNAYTAVDHTNYMFSINHDGFEEAIDRFSRFFIDPLFNPSGIEREMHAVDQEFSRSLELDIFRKYHVGKMLLNPEHPASRFAMGNLDTLKNIERESLIRWYNANYSADLMHLVIYSPLSLDALQSLTTQLFSHVKKIDSVPSYPAVTLTQEKYNGHLVHIKPVKELRQFSMTWELPGYFAKRLDSQPEGIVGFVLGHEGERSLLAELKREHLAEALSAGGANIGNNHCFFDVTIDLTEEGQRNLDTVIQLVYQTIRQFKDSGVPRYLFDENQKMATIRYEYQTRQDPFRVVARHARRLVREDLTSYPSKTQIPSRFAPKEVMELLSFLTPQRCQMTLLATPFPEDPSMDRREKWFGTEFHIRPEIKSKTTNWSQLAAHPNIQLPEKNPFIPTSLKLVGSDEKPKLFYESRDGKAYFAGDQTYQVPEVYWAVEIKMPSIVRSDAASLSMGDLFTRAVQEKMQTFAYPASLAGLNYNIERSNEGVLIQLGGYSDKAPKLFDAIVSNLKDSLISQEQFETYKASLLRTYRNYALGNPIKKASQHLRTVVYEDYVTEEEKADALEKIALKDYERFVEDLLLKTYLEGIFYGNLEEADAKQVWVGLQGALDSRPFLSKDHQSVRVIDLPRRHGPYFIHSRDYGKGSAVILALEHGPYGYKRRAAQEIFAKSIEQPFYDELRTKQQTGYIVFSYDDAIERRLFTFFAVQTNSHDVRDLLSRFELTIESFVRNIGQENFTQERFDRVKNGILQVLKQPPKNLSEMGKRLRSLAFDWEGDFAHVRKRISGVESISFVDFEKFAIREFGPTNRQRLAVMIKGEVDEKALTYTKVRNAMQLSRMSDYVSKGKVVHDDELNAADQQP